MPELPFPAPAVSVCQSPSLAHRSRRTRQTTERPILV
ncbi:hypothetical protein GA0115259_101266 [Streptomyces sp. MnatMP-M17]|nr:hypothetical protein GA0115259_101266 [Streptomyces sp. MnatMP-M17]